MISIRRLDKRFIVSDGVVAAVKALDLGNRRRRAVRHRRRQRLRKDYAAYSSRRRDPNRRPGCIFRQFRLTMTNANVETVEEVTVQNVQRRMLLLKYKGGKLKSWCRRIPW